MHARRLTKALCGGIQGRRRWSLPIAACLAQVQLKVLLEHVLVYVVCIIFGRLWQHSHLLLYRLVFHCTGCAHIRSLL